MISHVQNATHQSTELPGHPTVFTATPGFSAAVHAVEYEVRGTAIVRAIAFANLNAA